MGGGEKEKPELEVLFLSALNGCRALVRWRDTGERRCDVAVLLTTCVVGSYSCVTSAAVMKETVHVTVLRLRSL